MLNGYRGVPFTASFPSDHYLDGLLAAGDLQMKLKLATLENQLEEARHALAVATRRRWWQRKKPQR